MKTQKGQILVITLLVLTILSILTVSLVILNNRDVNQTVNSEVYDKIYNSSESKLQEVLSFVADPTIALSSLTTQYPSCANQGGTTVTYLCSFQIPSDSNPSIIYTDNVTVSNEKDIDAYDVFKDRPLTISLVGYSSTLNFSINKAMALDFTLIYLQGGTYKTLEGVYDPSTGTYSSKDITFGSYFTPSPSSPLAFTLSFPAAYNSFQLLSITPRSKVAGDSVQMSVTGSDLSTYPTQVRKFISTSYNAADPGSPYVKIETQIPLNAQTDGLLDYSLLTSDPVTIQN